MQAQRKGLQTYEFPKTGCKFERDISATAEGDQAALGKRAAGTDKRREHAIVYYIVRPKTDQILTKDLEWAQVGALNGAFQTLFGVGDDLRQAQHICQWMAVRGEAVSPVVPKNLRKKYKLNFPDTLGRVFYRGIQMRKYPRCMLNKPKDKKAVDKFQEMLRQRSSSLCPPAPEAAKECAEPGETSGSGAGVIREKKGRVEETSGQQRSFCFQGPPTERREFPSILDSVLAMREMDSLMKELPALIARKKKERQELEARLLDLQHLCEFYTLNASDGYRVYKAIHEARIARRNVKDDIIVLEAAQRFLGNISAENLCNFRKSIAVLEGRRYGLRNMTRDEIKMIIQNPKTLQLICEGTEGKKRKAEQKRS